MTDTTKPDLSREAVERIANCTVFITPEAGALETAATLLALLDAKEAAERLAEQRGGDIEVLIKWKEEEVTEARAAKEAAERQTAEAYRFLGNADKRQHQTDLELTEARASLEAERAKNAG